MNPRKRQTDLEWRITIARLVRITKLPVLPMYFAGIDSAWFQVLDLPPTRVRNMML